MTALLASVRRNLPVALIAFILLLGGASRPDVLPAVVVRPVALLLLVIALADVNRDTLKSQRVLIAVFAAYTAYIVLQLVPLPPALLELSHKREELLAASAIAGVDGWRPISVVPWLTWNGLFALVVPATGLAVAFAYQTRLRRLWPLTLLLFALANAVIGIVQILGSAGSFLYFYDITNSSSLVGLFANRNHAAAALCIGILAAPAAIHAYTSRARSSAVAATSLWLGALLLLVTATFLTGSRAALVFGTVSTAFSAFLHLSLIRSRGTMIKNWITAGMLVMITAVALSAAIAGDGIQRLLDAQISADARTIALPTVLQMTRDFLPFGAGLGVFPDVYAMYEPTRQVDVTYFNRAHNDVLEIVFETGVVGLSVVLGCAFAIFWLLTSQVRNWGSAGYEVRAVAVAVLLLLFVWSFFDYPLRTPTLGFIGAMGVALSRCAFTPDVRHASGPRDGQLGNRASNRRAARAG